ncbi:MAG: hypothetical protein J2P21_32915 [Chloracidobacterium sp.]|nr:hypothetical protein [Chloracidobacterium sp.]
MICTICSAVNFGGIPLRGRSFKPVTIKSRRSSSPISYGLLVGLSLALAGATTLARVLRPPNAPFTVNAGDPFAYVAAAALLTTVALAAMAGPSRRAAKLDPVVALRRD